MEAHPVSSFVSIPCHGSLVWLLCLGFLAPQQGQGQDAAPPKEAPPFMEPSQAFVSSFLDCHSTENKEEGGSGGLHATPADRPASFHQESIIEQIEVAKCHRQSGSTG